MKNIKWIIGIIILVVVIVFVVQNKNSKRIVVQNDVIKIGAVLSLSGQAINDGEAIKSGFDLAMSDLKEQGVNLEIIYSDDETDPKKTVSSIQFLKTQNVQAFAGFNWDFIYNTAIPVLDDNQLVNISPGNTSEYTSDKTYGFTSAPKTSYSKDLLVKFINENGIKKISFLGSRFPWSEVHLANLENAALEAGAEIVSIDWLQGGQEVDAISSLIPKIKQKEPDLLFVMVGGDHAISALFKRVQQNQLNVPMIAGTTAIGRFVKDNQDVLGSDYSLYSLVPSSSDGFIRHFKEVTGKNPGEYTEYAYDAILILNRALQENGEEGLREYLENNTFQGFSREYSFDENHDARDGLWQIRKDN